MDLFRRAWEIRLGSIALRGGWADGEYIRGLDAVFEIIKDTTSAPNKAKLEIYNLSANHRGFLEKQREISLSVSAGYESNVPMLFSGKIRTTTNRRGGRKRRKILTKLEGLDFLTVIEAEDRGVSYSSATIQQSYGPGTPVLVVLRQLVATLEIGEGNLSAVDTTRVGAGGVYLYGTTVSGPAWRELDRLLRSCGHTWSVQDGTLQVLQRGNPLAQSAIVLAKETGLVGSPAIASDGTISAMALMIPGLTPGRRVLIKSALITGVHSIKRVKYQGDTGGESWYANMDLI